MPILSVIAVFVGYNTFNDAEGYEERRWYVDFELADKSVVRRLLHLTGVVLDLASDLDDTAWLALRRAMLNPDQWVPVSE